MKNELRQGVPKATVARKYGISRQSIYNIICNQGKDAGERAVRRSMLDPFKEFINAKLADFDIPASSLFLEVQKLGYAGGMTTVKNYVRTVKGEQVRQVIERFETAPGRQAQIDWGECGSITVNGEQRKLFVFVLVLGYSRFMFARFTLSMRQPVLLTLLKEAFERFGVPQELLVDNMKTAVDRHAIGESVRFNSSFQDFCEHYGTTPMACPPYWPRAKGKVEAGIKFVKNSFLTGREFTTLTDLNNQLDTWLDTVANTRVHGTTGERPVDRYTMEVEFLRPASAMPAFDTRELVIRQVQPDSHVRFKGTAFSVPPVIDDRRTIGQSVHVRLVTDTPGSTFEILLDGLVLATHTLPTDKVKWVTLPAHAEQIKTLARLSRKPGKPKPRYRQETTPGQRASAAHTATAATAATAAAEAAAMAALESLNAPAVQVRELSDYEHLAHGA